MSLRFTRSRFLHLSISCSCPFLFSAVQMMKINVQILLLLFTLFPTILWSQAALSSEDELIKKKSFLDFQQVIEQPKLYKDSLINFHRFPISLKRPSHLQILNLSGSWFLTMSKEQLSFRLLNSSRYSPNFSSLKRKYVAIEPFNTKLITSSDFQKRELVLINKISDSLKKEALVQKVYNINLSEAHTFSGNINQLKNVKDKAESNDFLKQKATADSLAHLSLPPSRQLLSDQNDVLLLINRIDSSQLLLLPILSSFKTKNHSTFYLDSLRRISLNTEKLRMKENQDTSLSKTVTLQERESIIKRLYFEGIVGINNGGEYVTFSPAVAIKLLQPLSSGLGLNFDVNRRQINNNMLLGFRPFIRYELIKKKLNIQLENNSYFSKPASVNLEDKNKTRMNHYVFLGLGYLIKFSKNKNINLGALYQLNQNQRAPYAYFPFVFRAGISAFNSRSR